tara:strand:+ start:7147 stop:7839 length:693 start_codon:yes stop_codon:yes gene_type:complete
MNNFSISVIIPSKNDEDVFLKNYPSIKEFLISKEWDFEIILVSNGSKDSNLKLINPDELDINHITTDLSGKGRAIKFGIEKSIYDNLLFMDADSSVSINELEKFVHKNNFIDDVVIGTRRTRNSKNLKTPFIRKISGFMYIFLVNLLFSLNISDTQCGFKVFKKSDYLKIRKISFNNFSFDVELLVRFKEKNFTIVEIPVDYIHNSESNVKLFKDSITMFIDLLKLRLRN